jgi:hypothetical protein
MIDAWLSSSEKTTDPPGPPSFASAPTTPRLARYPEPNSSADSVPLKAASASSRRRWTVIVPDTRREAPAPAPQRIAASAAASRTRGWSASPR